MPRKSPSTIDRMVPASTAGLPAWSRKSRADGLTNWGSVFSMLEPIPPPPTVPVLRLWSMCGPHIDHNLSTGTVGGGGIGSNIENTDPQFVNPSALDFRLQAGSPAIDAGVTLSYVSSDVLGVSRPQGVADDIGAFEFH